MRQRTQHGFSFAITPDEEPHSSQCHAVIYANWAPKPRRCGNLKLVEGGDFCWVHEVTDSMNATKDYERTGAPNPRDVSILGGEIRHYEARP